MFVASVIMPRAGSPAGGFSILRVKVFFLFCFVAGVSQFKAERFFPCSTSLTYIRHMAEDTTHLRAPIAAYVRKDFAKLRENLTVQQALDSIRQQGLGEQIESRSEEHT